MQQTYGPKGEEFYPPPPKKQKQKKKNFTLWKQVYPRACVRACVRCNALLDVARSDPHTLRAAMRAPCAHGESALARSCITWLDFLVLPPLLKSIINGD